ncbi:MAG: twitching motility protein PilT [Candidatus Hecatellales archaeon B24]|nr:MAG: twitching motility protein PilT [Candidatus Hecatellales archaeon B24]
MKVADSSALVKYFSREEGWEKVREMILEGLVSLPLSIKEVANALWKKALNGEIRVEDVEKILADLRRSDAIKFESQNRYLISAFKIAVKNKVTVYDALFIELSKHLKAELVTSDSKQAKIAEKEGVKAIVV